MNRLILRDSLDCSLFCDHAYTKKLPHCHIQLASVYFPLKKQKQSKMRHIKYVKQTKKSIVYFRIIHLLVRFQHASNFHRSFTCSDQSRFNIGDHLK